MCRYSYRFVNNLLYLKGETHLKSGISACAILVILFIAVPCFGQESIESWVKDRADIKWAATPQDYPKSISAKDSVLWVGPIEDINAYVNEQKETVIEFLCRHLSLVKPEPAGVVEPIQAQDRQTGFFVISIRSPKMPLQQALDLREENKKKRHFAAVLGEPVDRRFFTVGRLAVYVHSEKAAMSDTLRVSIVK